MFTSVFSVDESDFYTETIHDHSLQKNLRDDYGVDGSGNNTDSYLLQQAINDISAAGGGTIFIPEGTYRLEGIVLKSNTHILIEANTIIEPYISSESAKAHIFKLGSNTTIRNVSVRGVNGNYIVNFIRHDPGMSLFNCGDVDNFLLADFTVNDRFTIYSAVGMSPASFVEGQITWPRNGVVKNASVLNAHYGYGFVQTQAASNVLFRNIHCTAGATLRIETGWTKMNDLQIGGVDRIFGRNVSCSEGNCAVMISPHSMHNGSVDLDTISSYSCVAAVKIGGGFVSTKYTNPDLIPGTFSDVKVRNVDATFGITARLKSQELIYIPLYREKYLSSISEDGGKSLIGPAIGAIKYGPDDYEDAVEITNVMAHGFLCQNDLVRDSDKSPSLTCKTLDTVIQAVDTLVNTWEATEINYAGSAKSSETSFSSYDTTFYKSFYIVLTTDTTVISTDSTIIMEHAHVTAIDTVVIKTDSMLYFIDPPENNIDTLFFNMDTTLTYVIESSHTISHPDTLFTYRDTTFTVMDTTITVTKETLLYSGEESVTLSSDSRVNLFPNPASDNIHLEIADAIHRNAYIEIFSYTGILFSRKEIETKNTELPICDLDNGVYLVRIVNGSKTYSKKIIIR